jgi:hypothetical protein
LPYIITIGTDNLLNVLIATSGTASGWILINVLSAFPVYSTAVAFDVVQDSAVNVSIATAFKSKTSDAVDVFYASFMPSKTLQTVFQNLALIAKQISGSDTGFVAHGLNVGSSDDSKIPQLTIEGSIGSVYTFYQVATNTLSAQRNVFVEQIKAGAESLVHHCMGFSFGQRSNCFLYDVAGARHLVVQSIADSNGGQLRTTIVLEISIYQLNSVSWNTTSWRW